MGVDITVSIVSSNGEMKHYDIYKGRNSEWFNQLQGRGYDTYNIYGSLPVWSGIPENAPKIIQEAYASNNYFSFNYISVKEYIEWFDEARPDVDAVWLTTYERWLYYKKGIYPEDAPHNLPEDANLDDYFFVEVEDKNESGGWLYDFCKDNELADDDIIVYYFDC